MAKYLTDTISVTELVRNLSTVIDNVRISGVSLYVTKGTQIVAKLDPPPKAGLSINGLISILESLPGLEADAPVMADTIKNIREKAELPSNPWV